MAHGFNRIASALFATYASSAGDGGEVIIEGSSSQTASSGKHTIHVKRFSMCCLVGKGYNVNCVCVYSCVGKGA